jgi:hypothetical protein
MVTELSTNAITLLTSRSAKLNDLGLLTIGYGENEEDFRMLEKVLLPIGKKPFQITESYYIESILIVNNDDYGNGINT